MQKATLPCKVGPFVVVLDGVGVGVCAGLGPFAIHCT